MTGVAPSTWKHFEKRVTQLYEQNAPQEEILRGIGQYVRRWKRLVLSGVRDVTVGDAFKWLVDGLRSCDSSGVLEGLRR